MEPWQSWGIVSVAGVAAYLYYSRSSKFKRGRAQLPLIAGKSQTNESKSPDRSKAQRKRTKNPDTLDKNISDIAEVSAASNPPNEKGLKKRKGGKKAGVQPAKSSAVDVSPAPVQQPTDSDDGLSHDIDNAEFARQLSGLKAGTPLNKPSTVAEPRKAKKPGKREEAPPVLVNGLTHAGEGPQDPNGVSTASSTTGADADDDLSPAVSPEFGAIRTPTAAGGDVSDMLEVPKQGPSVLRLTEPAEPQATRQPRPPKPVIEQETKKQRQNRKKNEERKMAREEEEKDRRIRLEKQLRTAREAEGRPAKNGLASSQAPVSNAWDKPEGETASKFLNLTANNDTLLDTFDRTPSVAKNSDNGSSADREWKSSELPSEEEQLRLLTELDGEGWNTVKKNGRAKKKNGDVGGKPPGSDQGVPITDEKSSAGRSKPASGVNGTAGKGGQGETTNSTTNDSGVDVSQPESVSASSTNPSQVKQPPPIDRSIWNRENIHKHPAYDARYPWALIGHPDDSDWAVV